MTPKIKDRDADSIASEQFIGESGGNLHTSLSWLDYAERVQSITPLYYSALHLRLSIEHLWCEILLAAKRGSLDEAEYKKAVSMPTTLYKLIDKLTPDYTKFCRFAQLIISADTVKYPPNIIWDMPRLKRIHGELGGRLLHFHGKESGGAFSDAWVSDQLRFLHDNAYWMWNCLTSKGNLVAFYPQGLKPDTREIWEEFRNGKIDEEGAFLRLKIMHPVISKRPRASRA